MLKPTIKLNKDLWQRVKQCAKAAGYSSPREFVEHVLEREVSRLEDSENKDEVVKKLKGLGYLE